MGIGRHYRRGHDRHCPRSGDPAGTRCRGGSERLLRRRQAVSLVRHDKPGACCGRSHYLRTHRAHVLHHDTRHDPLLYCFLLRLLQRYRRTAHPCSSSRFHEPADRNLQTALSAGCASPVAYHRFHSALAHSAHHYPDHHSVRGARLPPPGIRFARGYPLDHYRLQGQHDALSGHADRIRADAAEPRRHDGRARKHGDAVCGHGVRRYHARQWHAHRGTPEDAQASAIRRRAHRLDAPVLCCALLLHRVGLYGHPDPRLPVQGVLPQASSASQEPLSCAGGLGHHA